MECIALIVNLVMVEDDMFFVMLLLLLSIKWRLLCFSSRATTTKPGENINEEDMDEVSDGLVVVVCSCCVSS